ncbi:uncharacterized protein N7498_002564 [Penicillium cinerascens]|uniref:Uncharacterized protein n=1 Tax=Penicillium cinerascens TaxID=70096 RepID=A0A9W9NAA8_9EURO|nr:uncharacterized protein N7498_002564 [Penicillium cinerascens]KAJ5216157.1 hypothetical protein N7498_002564 [Penicillium cinerascens]
MSKRQKIKRADPLNTPIQRYNGSIRAIIDKAITEPNSLPLVAMINILFICFSYFHKNLETAAAQIKSGIGLLQKYRETQGVVAPWGTSYASFEARDPGRSIRDPVRDQDTVTIFDHIQMGLGRWRCDFDDLIHLQKRKWNNPQRRAADMIRIISLGTGYSVTPYRVVCGCDWNAHRAMDDEWIELTTRTSIAGHS